MGDVVVQKPFEIVEGAMFRKLVVHEGKRLFTRREEAGR